MLDLKSELSHLDYFVDNEFLLKYCRLIERNIRTKRVPRRTHMHHVLPRSWFKLTNQVINDELNNLVNLSHKDHMLAHYYLCLCTEDPFRFANQLALACLLGDNKIPVFDKQLTSNLPMYNNIYEEYIIKLRTGFKLYEEKED